MAGEADVLGFDLSDALDRDFGKLGQESVGEEAEDGGFMGGIDSVDIEFVIGFGISQILSLLECGGKIGASLRHSGKNIVGGPINNPVQAEELICD